MIFTLLFRTFSVVSDLSRFHLEVCYLKEILKKNAFSIKLIVASKAFSIKESLRNQPHWETSLINSEKKDLVIVLAFFGKSSLDLRILLKNSISKNLPFCKIRVIFKSSTRISNLFQFKDKMPYCLRSNVVYTFSCGRCNATDYGETCRHLSVRVGKHLGISPLTGKKLKPSKKNCFICFNKSLLKMTKNAFYFILKALFVL